MVENFIYMEWKNNMKKIIINKENPSGIALDFTTEDTEKYNVKFKV